VIYLKIAGEGDVITKYEGFFQKMKK